MKKRLLMMICAMVLSLGAVAQNHWNVYAGGSIAHKCERKSERFQMYKDYPYGWGGGAFLGGGYEIGFNSHWNLTPSIEFEFVNNGAIRNVEWVSFYGNHVDWQSNWNLNIPVIAAYQCDLSKKLGLRIGVGPYLQESLAGRRYKYNSEDKEAMTGNFSNRFNVGFQGEIGIDTKNHFSYMFRARYPILKEGWIRKTLVLSLGVKYSF